MCDPVIWREDRTGTDYRLLTPADVTALEAEFEAHGRAALLIGS